MVSDPISELLGTPHEYKKHLVSEEGHFDFPRNTVAREVSNWFDTYLGPVRQGTQAQPG